LPQELLSGTVPSCFWDLITILRISSSGSIYQHLRRASLLPAELELRWRSWHMTSSEAPLLVRCINIQLILLLASSLSCTQAQG